MNSKKYMNQLEKILFNHCEILHVLKFLYQIEPNAFIAAGVIRNAIWAHLHGYHYSLYKTEVDVIYYDSQDDGTCQNRLKLELQKAFPLSEWDIVNQALVHEWYVTDQGKKIPPLSSIEYALSLWPETATAVAIRLNQNNELECIAPFGLNDLFELKLRWNKALVSEETFNARLKQKTFLEKWPKLKIIS